MHVIKDLGIFMTIQTGCKEQFYISNDMVNQPKHYNMGNIPVIDFLEDQRLDYHCASAVAYICRARHKGQEVEDLQKAIWYLQRKIAVLTAH